MRNRLLNVVSRPPHPKGWVHPFVQAANEAQARIELGETAESVFARLEQREGVGFANVIRFALASRRAHGR